MALIKWSKCGREVSDKMTSPTGNRWFNAILTSIVIIVIGSGCSNSSQDKSAKVESTFEQTFPDKALFEVSGKVKQITDIKNPVLPIHTHAGDVIEFTKDGKWENYSQAGGDEYKVTIRRNENNQITKIDGTNLDYSWSIGYEWDGDKVSKEILYGVDGTSSTILTYEDGKLKTISSEGNDIDDKIVFTYTLIEEKLDGEGNWIERTWQEKMETYSFHADINGYVSTPDFTTTEKITELRTITYYE